VPKMKTKKSLKRRIKVTATGKLLHYREGRRHLQSGKRAKRRRKLRRAKAVPKHYYKAYMQLLSPSL
jgi:large subunit ribosomal protein L35